MSPKTSKANLTDPLKLSIEISFFKMLQDEPAMKTRKTENPLNLKLR